jgi:Asp-tRNA(Asn)/Glu-tRNA(Gln) amidotransferase A subunit family amidase
MPALALRDAIRDRHVSPVEAVTAVLSRIEAVNPAINAFVTVVGEQALEAAKDAERRLTANHGSELGVLHGVPTTVKDLTSTAGVRTTFGSVHYAEHVPTTDALGWARLKDAGCILIGKTTTPEFGMKGITESDLTGITCNPWNVERTSGGSSGGAAASIAAGLGHLAWGSDGGGSIRVPSACCGVVGLKASLGRVPLSGEFSVCETAATAGPITRTVADSALMLSVTAGPAPGEPFALPASEVDFLDALADANVDGLRIAYCPDLGGASVAAEVRACVDAAVEFFADSLGAHVEVVTVALPDPMQYFIDFWCPSFAYEADEGALAGTEPPALIAELAALGRDKRASELYRTMAVTRAEIAAGFARVFGSYDLLLTSTMPVAAFPHPGEVGGNTHVDGEPVQYPALDFHRLTEPFSHARAAGHHVPCGFTPDGLPVGLQIAANHHGDAAVLRAATAYEAATAWHERRPPRLQEGGRA